MIKLDPNSCAFVGGYLLSIITLALFLIAIERNPEQ